MTRGRIFDIQRFSIHDGPGIRTTVFMKGCSLDCVWCHNPESISFSRQIQTYFTKCIGCGKCFEACVNGAHVIADGKRIFNRNLCEACGRCVAECYSGSLVMAGTDIDVGTLMVDIEADRPFYEDSGGGVTFSGGEPLLQSEFVAQALKASHEAGIHTAVDTAGNVNFSLFEDVIPYTDMFLYDLKAMDDSLHRELTGASNGRILENLRRLGKAGIPVRIRIPVVTGLNDCDEGYVKMADFLGSVGNIEAVEPLAYHSLGAGKLESLGESSEGRVFETPSKERMGDIGRIFSERGFRVISR